MQYLEAQDYGFNIIIKEYAKFPKFFPLPCHFEHGWTVLDDPLITDLAVDKPLMLVFNNRRAGKWKNKSDIPVKIMGSPFCHFRKIHNIVSSKTARGTVAFPSHSTKNLVSKFNIDEYCKHLNDLPEKFKPITVCLLWLDYLDQSAKIYQKSGFSVVTCGPKVSNSLEFVKNYYQILSNHKYVTSNDIGSYTFYAIEMGLPFFLVGETPEMIMKKGRSDPNVSKKYKMTDFDRGRRITALFSTGPVTMISPAQKNLVSEEIGQNECLSSRELNKLLWIYSRKNHFLVSALIPYLVYALLSKLGLGPSIIKLKNKLFKS
jgi:hypothetical protein